MAILRCTINFVVDNNSIHNSRPPTAMALKRLQETAWHIIFNRNHVRSAQWTKHMRPPGSRLTRPLAHFREAAPLGAADTARHSFKKGLGVKFPQHLVLFPVPPLGVFTPGRADTMTSRSA
jgi:hypothetical protein